MKEFRNKTYTVYGGIELELAKNSDESYLLISRNNICPDSSFALFPSGDGIYTKKISADQLTNAFVVTTWADYAQHVWHAERMANDSIRLWSDQKVDVPEITMVDQHWFEVWVKKSQISRIWEERNKSNLPLPYPKDILPVVEVPLL